MSNYSTNASVTLHVNGQEAQHQLEQLRKRAEDLQNAIAKAARAGNTIELKQLRKELRETNRSIRDMESRTMQVEQVMRRLDTASPRELQRTLRSLEKQMQDMERGSKAWNTHAEKIRLVRAEMTKMNNQLRNQESLWERFNRKLNDWQTRHCLST